MPPEEYKKEHFTHYFKRRFHTCLICKETMDWDRTIITGENSGQPKEFGPKPKEGNPKSSISAETAERGLFRPKVSFFGRKGPLSAESPLVRSTDVRSIRIRSQSESAILS